jgi:3-phenylpropionate/trans-cinnamate dioxygenase ferredoxin subunit
MDRITITVRNNGSLFISGDDMAKVRLVDHEGNEISTEGRKALSLCRCGASTKKPFCDGTHSKIGFQGAIAAQQAFDAGQPPAQAIQAAAASATAPAATPTPAPAQPPAPQPPATGDSPTGGVGNG